jgi:hypothetical protein
VSCSRELEIRRDPSRRSGRLTLAPVNKVHRVTTLARVAEMLGEDEELLWDLADEMDPEAGLIWVYGTGEIAEGVMAFTDFGIETLTDLIRTHRENQSRRAPTTDAK